MTERSVVHATFVLERTYKSVPERVFAHWADPALKRKWFASPEEESTEIAMDFRVGGCEHASGPAPGGGTYAYDAHYDDIVPGERLVYGYTMDMDGVRISSSLASVVLEAAGNGTRLTYTEHGVFLDGGDTPETREHGSAELLDQLGEVVDR